MFRMSRPNSFIIGRRGKHAFSFMLPPNLAWSSFEEFSSVRVVTEALMSTIFPITPDFSIETRCLNAGQYAVLCATIRVLSLAPAIENNSSASERCRTNGVSASTCFPARRAALAYS